MARFLQIIKQPTQAIISFLNENVIGTPGKSMVYRQMRTQDKINKIPNPIFLVLQRNNQVLSTACFCERTSEDYTTQYVRYFSFKTAFRSSSTHKKNKTSKSSLKEDIHGLLKEQSPLISQGSLPTLFYAYVDPNNERSNRLCHEFGFIPTRTFSTLSFSRFSPKKSVLAKLISTSDKDEIKRLLKDSYQNHSCYTEENLFFDENYLVIKNERNEVIAGLQATKEYWKIHELPRISGWFILNLFSKLPLFDKLINREHWFVAYDYIFCKKGSENELEVLFEHALAHHRVHSGIVSVDQKSKLYELIKEMSLGPLNKIKKEVTAHVIVKVVPEDNDFISAVSKRPCFISTLDLT